MSHSLFLRFTAKAGIVAISLFMLAACSEVTLLNAGSKKIARADQTTQGNSGIHTPPRGKGVYKVGNPYQVNGVWYTPKEDPNYDETGIASWYGAEFHGKPTANGEIFDMNELTAAHKTLPMPIFARVTNLENGRSIIVRVNDRGPFANSRIIDLSRRSAQLLGFEAQGTARVRVQYVGPASGDPMIAQPVAPREPDGNAPQVVAAPRAGVTAATLPPPNAAVGSAARQEGQPIQVNAPQSRAQAAPDLEGEMNKLNNQQVRVEPVRSTSIFVQAGAFSRYDNAQRVSAQVSSFGQTRVTQAMVNGTDFFRVRLGPIANVQEADQILSALHKNGFADARIIVE